MLLTLSACVGVDPYILPSPGPPPRTHPLLTLVLPLLHHFVVKTLNFVVKSGIGTLNCSFLICTYPIRSLLELTEEKHVG